MKVPEPPGRGMSFAERQLRRHGWRRGQGLGKRQDGIAEAIRVKVKCDTAGVGHDAAEAFTFHWWDHVFNQAAANISVESGQDGISMRSLSEQGAHISNRKPCRAGRAGTELYGRFVKSATLTACGEQPTELPRGSSDDDDDDKLDLSSVRRLTDAELVQVCGGRTAHKGARHGLTMSAKLARLEEQERAFLATYRQKEQQQEPPGSSPAAERQEKRRKKRKHSRDRGDPEELQSQQLSEEEVMGEEGMVMKRKKKKTRKNQEVSREEEVVGEKGKVAKRKQQQEENEEELAEAEMEKKSKKKKKKKKKEEEDKEELAETEVPLEDTDQAGHCPRKKRKRRKEAE